MVKFTRIIVLLLAVAASAQTDKVVVGKVIDNWHNAAAEAKFETYFGLMTEDAVFIGTDPTENWKIDQFKSFAKPYFDKGKAWDFKPVERNIYFSADGQTAWFDELLDTWMKLCRGSGVLRRENGQWKIAHYVLSIAIPNDNTDEVIQLKKDFDDKHLQKKKEKK